MKLRLWIFVSWVDVISCLIVNEEVVFVWLVLLGFMWVMLGGCSVVE